MIITHNILVSNLKVGVMFMLMVVMVVIYNYKRNTNIIFISSLLLQFLWTMCNIINGTDVLFNNHILKIWNLLRIGKSWFKSNQIECNMGRLYTIIGTNLNCHSWLTTSSWVLTKTIQYFSANFILSLVYLNKMFLT